MAQRYDIVHIQFQANAAKANAAIESMRASAKACHDEGLRMKKLYEQGMAANLPTAQLEEMAAKIRKVTTEERQWTSAINAAVKGVAVLDQAIIAFNNGTLEQMNVQLSKTARNAAQLQMNRATVGSREWMEMKVLVEELDKNILKGTNDLKLMQETIRGGGTIAAKNLKEAEAALKGLMEATTRGTAEWKTYKSMLTDVQGAMTKATDIERQMKGEVVTLADAKRVLAATDSEMAAQITANFQKRAAAQKAIVEATEQEIASHQQLVATEQQSIIKIDEEAVTIAKDVAALREEASAKQALTEANKQLNAAQNELTRLQKEEAGETAKIAAQQEKVKEAKMKVADATERQTAAEAAAAKARKNGSLEQQEKRLDELNTKRQSHITNIQREEQEMQRLGQIALEAGDKQAIAEQRAAQASNLTKAHIEQSISILRKQQETADSMTYVKIEKEIDRLTTKLDVMTGKVMSFADAMKLSATAGTSAFTGTAEGLQKAQQTLEKSIATTDKGTAKYDRLRMALARIKAESAGAGMSSQQMQKILANPTAEKSVDNLKNAVARSRAEIDVMGQRLERMQRLLAQAQKNGQTEWANRLQTSIKNTSKALDEQAASTQKADLALKQLQGTSKATVSQFDKAWSRLKTYVGLYMGAAVAIQKLVGAMGDLMELSDKMGEVRKTTGFTADEVGRLSDSLAKLDTRTPIQELLGLSAAAGQLGLKTQEDIRGFTEAANQLIVALPEMGRESATSLMKIANATGDLKRNGGDVEETLQRVGSTIIALRANSASAAPAITDFVSRVGAVGAQAGITIDQIAAMGSTIDALGGRVEMSATALSRMIPAIRNNSFAVANAIGVTESYLKSLSAMDQLVLVFRKMKESVKGIDTSTEEGMNQMADNVEALLSKNATMAEVMKELNQQGARAGIVFGLMSQNVDELERQLGTAAEAYQDNIALMNEYNNMNETTAAKWARLKNTFEEMFVADEMQRVLGGIIDALRWIVDVIKGDVGPAFKWLSGLVQTFIMYWAVLKVGLGEAIFVKLIDGIKNLGLGLVNLITNTKGYIIYSRQLAAAQLQLKTATDAASVALAKQKVAAIEAEMAQKGLNKAMLSNVWMALAAAILYAGKALWDWATKTTALEEATARLDAEMQAQVKHVNNLVKDLNSATDKTDKLKAKEKELTEQTEVLRKEVDELKKSNDGSTESTDKLNQKEDELKETEKKLEEATSETNKANGERRNLINEINSKYSTYLGYMLSEKTAAEQVASAHMLIVAALKEEMAQKSLNRKEDAIDEEYAGKIKEYSEDSLKELEGLTREQRQRIRDQWNTVLASISYDIDEQTKKGKFSLAPVEGLTEGGATETAKGMKATLKEVLKNIIQKEAATTTDRNGVTQVYYKGGGGQVELKSLEDFVTDIWGGGMKRGYDDGFGDWAKTMIEKARDLEEARHDAVIEVNTKHGITITKAVADIESNSKNITETLKDNQTLTEDQIIQLAQNVNAINTDLTKYKGEIKDIDKYVGKDKEGKAKDVSLTNVVENLFKDRDEKTRKAILAAAQAASKASPTNPNPQPDKKPYGDYNKVTSPYEDWNASDLVARRKEMLERVKALAAGADVQAVLSEDAKFISEATRKNIKDTKQAIEWYNTERLKIQDALHEKHLTNSGDWADPKKGGKKASKLVQDEMKYYLDELDAYYTERKAKIQEARNNEEISEAEAKNRTLRNEAEWQQRRAELQQLYSKKRKEVTEEEQQAIFDIISERTGDTVEYVKKDIDHTVKFIEKVGSEKSKAAMDKIYGDIDLGMEKSFLRQRNAIGQHLQAIEDIVNKENPFNGIVKSLQDNLGKMNVLLADITDEQERTIDKETERTMFILEQSTKGYSLTWEELMREMAKNGWQAWADAINADTAMQTGLMHQITKVFEAVQDAIRKEASQIKKDAELMWNNILLPGGDGKTTVKDAFEQTISALGIQEGRVSRANSLIGAGQASERVADKLAIQQMKVQLASQRYQYNLMRKQGMEKIAMLEKEAELQKSLGNTEKARSLMMQKQNVEQALNLATRKEQTEELKQQEAIIAKTEESEARLYKELRDWADLFASSLQSVFEASNAGQEQYYNDLAKMRLTGEGSGGGTYIVIDNAGTADAEAHYETLSGEEALKRQLEIEQDNAKAEAWKKVMDDLNAKINDFITDQMNAWFQNQVVDANTEALGTNTAAIVGLTEQIGGNTDTSSFGPYASGYQFGPGYEEAGATDMGVEGVSPLQPTEAHAEEPWNNNWNFSEDQGGWNPTTMSWDTQIEQNNLLTDTIVENSHLQADATADATKKMTKSTQAAFASMTQAANLYGIAYQAMSNDNLSAAQKFGMIAIQAAGQAAITSLTVGLTESTAETAKDQPVVLSKLWKQLGWAAVPVYAIFTGLLGGLMGLAASKVGKAKSEISQATGASVGAGRLATGMLTYAEGNVNEFTDPNSLTEGRSYNVDAADGKTYRAKYMGKGAKTHITNGPEFHLVGEAGREAIIDAKTTRLMQMDDTGIWKSIQTLYNGGSIATIRRTRGRGVRPFASGNMDEFEDALDGGTIESTGGMNMEQLVAFQQSLDRNSAVMERLAEEGIEAFVSPYGKRGIVNGYDTYKKQAQRYGQKYQ